MSLDIPTLVDKNETVQQKQEPVVQQPGPVIQEVPQPQPKALLSQDQFWRDFNDMLETAHEVIEIFQQPVQQATTTQTNQQVISPQPSQIESKPEQSVAQAEGQGGFLSRYGMWLGLGAAAAVVLGALAFFFKKRGDSDKGGPDDRDIPPPPPPPPRQESSVDPRSFYLPFGG